MANKKQKVNGAAKKFVGQKPMETVNAPVPAPPSIKTIILVYDNGNIHACTPQQFLLDQKDGQPLVLGVKTAEDAETKAVTYIVLAPFAGVRLLKDAPAPTVN